MRDSWDSRIFKACAIHISQNFSRLVILSAKQVFCSSLWTKSTTVRILQGRVWGYFNAIWKSSCVVLWPSTKHVSNCYTPETRKQSTQWTSMGKPACKSSKIFLLPRRVMLSDFWYSQDVFFIHYLKKGRRATLLYYIKMIRTIWNLVPGNRPDRRGQECFCTMTTHQHTLSPSTQSNWSKSRSCYFIPQIFQIAVCVASCFWTWRVTDLVVILSRVRRSSQTQRHAFWISRKRISQTGYRSWNIAW